MPSFGRHRCLAGRHRTIAAAPFRIYRAMMEMSVQATVPGGESMTVNVSGQDMMVMVPPGIAPGQNFTFQVPAPQPVLAQPVMAQPVMAQPAVAAGTLVQQTQYQTSTQYAAGAPNHGPPPGAPPGGQWQMQQYCGDNTIIATIIVVIFATPAACCIPCCKCDSRMVYNAGGVLFLPNGSVAPPDCC